MSVFLLPEMDDFTRRRIISLFPRGSNENGSETCRYINQYSFMQCGRPTQENGGSCSYHMRDFQLWCEVVTQEINTPAWADVVPQIQEETLEHPMQRNETIHSFSLLIDLSNTCSVCEESIDLLSLPCRHVICLSCYNQLLSKTCPECRSEIIPSFIRRV
jgi:hypothetical protein